MSGQARGNFAYAQVRLQARLGAGPTATDFERLHAARDLPALLQVARTLPLARHVERIEPSMSAHDIERRLRDEWTATVHEVARWQPAAWRDAIEWLRWLVYLPALQKLARGGRAPAWTRSDPVLGPVVAADLLQRERGLTGTALEPFRASFGTNAMRATEAWLRHWRSLWPVAPSAASGLDRIAALIQRADAELRAAPHQAESGPVLARLRDHLLRLLRRNPSSPTAAVAWLGIEALTLLDLRGAASARALCAGATT